MSVDFGSLSHVLKHSMRREILLALYERKSMSYIELMGVVGATGTGKFNYHLKILGDLIEKDQNGKYVLTEKGHMAAQLFQKFPEKKTQQTPLHTADAMLIGFAGVVLTIINPVFWTSSLIALLELKLTLPFLILPGLLGFVYGAIVPGAVMWFLTVRRAHSHDTYDLFKPPLAAFVWLLVLLVTMVLMKIDLTITITSPRISEPPGYTYSAVRASLQLLLFLGLAFSFLGVGVAEFARKIWKRTMA